MVLGFYGATFAPSGPSPGAAVVTLDSKHGILTTFAMRCRWEHRLVAGAARFVRPFWCELR